MVKVRELSEDSRQKVIDLHKLGNGYKTIHKKLSLPLSTVVSIIKKFKATGVVATLPGRGRKCILPRRAVRQVVREVTINPKTTAGDLQHKLASSGYKVSKTTIRRRLHEFGIRGQVTKKTPRKRRVELAKIHLTGKCAPAPLFRKKK